MSTTTTITNPWTEAFPVVPNCLPGTSEWRFHQLRLGKWQHVGFYRWGMGWEWTHNSKRSRFLRRLHRDLAVAYAGRALAFSVRPYSDYELDWIDLFTRRNMQGIAELAADAPRIVGELYDWAQMNREPEERVNFGNEERTVQNQLLTLGIPRPWDRRWATRDACTLARAAHANWDFSVMPILADMLEDAGCEDADMLRWCRELPPHCWYRGAWVVERLRTMQWRAR